jgi:two-component sensor histidine kinase
VATLPELARLHTTLEAEPLAQLTRLVAAWGILADLCFADLLLFVPTASDDGKLVVIGQVRPSNSQTLHHDDLIGRVIDESERPLVARAYRTGDIMDGEIAVTSRGGEPARLQCIPVRWDGEVIAVLTREAAITVGRRPGELERSYVGVFERFARMLVSGLFPYPIDEGTAAEAPRVGDGALLLDDAARVSYASPNAVTALHRLGAYSNVEGIRLDEAGVNAGGVDESFASHLPVMVEVERRPDVIVLLRCMPLLDLRDGAEVITGAIVLLRDVTDLRRRDQLLLSKDQAIREVHHRVKNNLQTIGSLLRLQGRRLAPGDGREALEEAERRIRSIALVHEILSRDAGEQVPFNEIVKPLVRMAQEAFTFPGVPVTFEVEGDAGELPATIATPLAVVLTELLQNAVEHAFPQGSPGGQISVRLDNDGERLRVVVADDGPGFPEDFSIGSTRSLGLSIARSLIETQMTGTIQTRNEDGATVELTVPLTDPDRLE